MLKKTGFFFLLSLITSSFSLYSEIFIHEVRYVNSSTSLERRVTHPNCFISYPLNPVYYHESLQISSPDQAHCTIETVKGLYEIYYNWGTKQVIASSHDGKDKAVIAEGILPHHLYTAALIVDESKHHFHLDNLKDTHHIILNATILMALSHELFMQLLEIGIKVATATQSYLIILNEHNEKVEKRFGSFSTMEHANLLDGTIFNYENPECSEFLSALEEEIANNYPGLKAYCTNAITALNSWAEKNSTLSNDDIMFLMLITEQAL